MASENDEAIEGRGHALFGRAVSAQQGNGLAKIRIARPLDGDFASMCLAGATSRGPTSTKGPFALTMSLATSAAGPPNAASASSEPATENPIFEKHASTPAHSVPSARDRAKPHRIPCS
jgi:hypothetical protein